MKTPLHTLAALAALTLTTTADTPDAILKNYRTRATQATQRLNETLEKQSTPLIAALVGKGDTAGAEALTAQVKAKLAGEPVAAPHVSAATLFAQYDGARATALKPVQASSIARLDSLLKTAGGPKIEDLAAITKARSEIEAGQVIKPSPVALEWTYHGSPTSTTNIATVKFHPDGQWEMSENNGQTTKGQWKSNAKGDHVEIKLANNSVWKVSIDGTLATIERPDVGVRYLRVKGAPTGK